MRVIATLVIIVGLVSWVARNAWDGPRLSTPPVTRVSDQEETSDPEWDCITAAAARSSPGSSEQAIVPEDRLQDRPTGMMAVVNECGHPVSDAHVVSLPGNERTRTNDKGQFDLERWDGRSNITLVITKSNHVTTYAYPIDGRDRTQIVLPRAGQIEGQVILADLTTGHGLRAFARRSDAQDGASEVHSSVLEDGRFLLEHLEPGRWDVIVRSFTTELAVVAGVEVRACHTSHAGSICLDSRQHEFLIAVGSEAGGIPQDAFYRVSPGACDQVPDLSIEPMKFRRFTDGLISVSADSPEVFLVVASEDHWAECVQITAGQGSIVLQPALTIELRVGLRHLQGTSDVRAFLRKESGLPVPVRMQTALSTPFSTSGRAHVTLCSGPGVFSVSLRRYDGKRWRELVKCKPLSLSRKRGGGSGDSLAQVNLLPDSD